MRKSLEVLDYIILFVIIVCVVLLALGIDGEIKTLLITNIAYIIARWKNKVKGKK